MILPVTVYGDPVLRGETKNVDKELPGLSELIENMFQTMYQAEGVGLAAPQVGLSLRLFVVDGSPASHDEEPELKEFKRVFINPEILEVADEEIVMEEGCLSLPNIHENVSRPETVLIRYFDEHWEEHTETYSGFRARIIQHEYDHLEGHLFVDHISPLKKRLLKSKLMSIATGKTRAAYLTRVPLR
jgi:peptide deformylase